MLKKPEILSPAGNFEKLISAVRFGADAVYLAGKNFGMRAASDNFSDDELLKAVEYLHERGKKLYLTVNVMPKGVEYQPLREFLTYVGSIGVDGIIAADLGVIETIRELLPEMPIHVSTQASICSPEAARAYVKLGASRLVLARELTLPEIAAIRAAIPENVELEAFV
ncbi:MAG: U32 family peptidase, partial [Clostridia bacterium]|nr:U32 family peptidase [Clostridia bacterium]